MQDNDPRNSRVLVRVLEVGTDRSLVSAFRDRSLFDVNAIPSGSKLQVVDLQSGVQGSYAVVDTFDDGDTVYIYVEAVSKPRIDLNAPMRALSFTALLAGCWITLMFSGFIGLSLIIAGLLGLFGSNQRAEL